MGLIGIDQNQQKMIIKKICILTILIFSAAGASAQFLGETEKQIYKAPGYKDSLEQHKTVAILPFKATISYKRMPKNFNAETNAAEEKKLGFNMQQGMFT